MSTLNENILKVKETFEDIAIAIEEKGVEISPCDSPMVYGDKIRSIVEQVVFDPEKIYAEAYDIDEPQPTVEVIKSEDNGAIFIFGLRRGAPGKDGENGTSGQDGITPQLKIEDGYWYVSYDNGSTWTRLSKATGEDGAPGQDGQDGADGNGIVSITKLFAVNNDSKNHPTSGWTEDMPSTSSDNRYLWCEETTTYTKSSPITIYYIIAVHGEPDADGTGNDAPLIYPAGVWSASKTYASTNEKRPYVFYAEDEKYYMVKANTSVPQGVVPTNTTYWDPIDSFEAIYADIGLFNQALVGKWVFHGNYMFSQDGVLGYYHTEETRHMLYVPSGIGSGTMSGQNCSYEVALNQTLSQYSGGEFNTTIRSFNLWEKIENGIWIPNVLFNAVTGEGWFAGKNIVFNKDGSGYVGNKTIEWSNEYSLINESSCTIDVYGAKDPETWYEPIPKTNVLHINAINGNGNGDVGYNKSHELVLNLSNYKFVGENLKVTNYSNKLIYLHCDAAGGNARQYFMKEGFDVYWGDNNVSTNYNPNFIETFVLQPYSEAQFRLVTIPSLYTTEGCQYIIVTTPVSYFYRNNQQCLTNTSVYDFDFDLKLNSLSKNNFEFDTCTNEDQHRVFQWSDINFDFIRAIEDGDREFIDDSEQVQLKIYEGEEEKITVDGFANKFIKTNDLKNADCFIDIDTRPYWRFQLYYKNVCFAELKTTINSHPC